MKTKLYLKRITAIIIGFCIVISVLCFYQENFCILDNHNSWRIKNFYKEDNDTVDVVILGSSEVFSGYYPGVVYDKYGITSYNFATDSASPEIWKSELKEILKHQKPKVILVEISGALYEDDKKIYDDPALRRFFDNIPLSIEKVNGLNECELQEELISYYCPLVKYHGDFGNALNAYKTKKYFDSIGYSKLKGVFTYSKIDKSKEKDYNKLKDRELNSNAKNYLIEFLKYCKTNNIPNVVFCRFPHKCTNDQEVRLVELKNTAKKIIKSYGFNFWDFQDSKAEIGLDNNFDYYNSLHLNVYGSEKLSNYIGGIFKTKFDISMNDNSIKKWEDTGKLTKKFINHSKSLIKRGEEKWLSENEELINELENN